MTQAASAAGGGAYRQRQKIFGPRDARRKKKRKGNMKPKEKMEERTEKWKTFAR